MLILQVTRSLQVMHIRGRNQEKLDINTYPNIQKMGKIGVGQNIEKVFIAMKYGTRLNVRFLPLLVRRQSKLRHAKVSQEKKIVCVLQDPMDLCISRCLRWLQKKICEGA